MAVSKVILNGTTLIDTTDKTVTAGSMLNGVTALKNDGTTATGSIASKSSTDLTASGATVTAPAGYYSSAASKSVATTTHPKPTASINSTTGVVTASHTQTAGYVSAGTTTGTLELSTQAATTITPSTSSQTAVAAGKFTTGAVTVAAMPSGTAGTPTASKGTVSNHSVTVTPSVTNSTGYITGGTVNGTAVTVSASELVSGTKSITENGAGIDVTNYASVDVAVESGGGGEVWSGTVTVVNKLGATISSVNYFDQNSASIQSISLAPNQSVTFSAPLGTYVSGHSSVQYVATMFSAYVPSAYYAETPTVLESGYKLAVGKSAGSGVCDHLIFTKPNTGYGVSQTSVTIEIVMP